MATRPRTLIAGNWKMNGLRRAGTAELAKMARAVKTDKAVRCEVLVCPPAVLIPVLRDKLKDLGPGKRILLGGQDCHTAASGAHTGDISAAMLKDAGCSHVIVGHSERRADHGETDTIVRAKAEAGLAAGLKVIVCIGETLAERDAGATLRVIGRQLKGSLPAGANAGNTIVAYEPVWAIGTGRTPTIADIAKAHNHLRRRLAGLLGDEGHGVRILYGGSVKPGNAGEILAVENVNGALVGGASLLAKDFVPIIKAG
jgi:triosephosphate isomerase